MEIFPRLIISHLSYNEEIEKMEWNFPRTHQKNILKELEEGRNFATVRCEKSLRENILSKSFNFDLRRITNWKSSRKKGPFAGW